MASTDNSITSKESAPTRQIKSKAIAYVAIMSALGSVLAFISICPMLVRISSRYRAVRFLVP